MSVLLLQKSRGHGLTQKDAKDLQQARIPCAGSGPFTAKFKILSHQRVQDFRAASVWLFCGSKKLQYMAVEVNTINNRFKLLDRFGRARGPIPPNRAYRHRV